MDNLFIHFGAHKTGTTYLQKLFKRNPELFEKRNSEFLIKKDARDPMNELIRWHWKKNTLMPSGNAFPADFDAFLDQLDNSDRESIFLSYEGMLGRMDIGRTKTIYPPATIVMKNLAERFKDKNIKVAFCIREYGDFLESSYKWLVKDGIKRRFERYEKGVNEKKMSWIPVIEDMIDIFGRDNVFLWKYENYRANSREINLELLRFFYGTVDENEINYEKDKEVNVSFNTKALDVMLWFNQNVEKLGFLGKDEAKELKRNFKRAVNQTFDKSNDPVKPVFLSDDKKTWYAERYQQDLERIEELYGRPLY